MMKKRNYSHLVIPYTTWLRYCTIQEHCFLFSSSFLTVNLFYFIIIKEQSILSFIHTHIEPFTQNLYSFINSILLKFPVLIPIQPLFFDFIRTLCFLVIIILIYYLFGWIAYRSRIDFLFSLGSYIAFFAVVIVGFLYTAPQISSFLFFAPFFFLVSMWFWRHIHSLRFRHILLFFSILFYIAGIWFEMLALHDFPLRDKLYPFWNGMLNMIPIAWEQIGSLISIGLTLLTGCLLIISWSPNTPCQQWNPFSAGTLMQSRRTATLAVGLSIMMCFSSIDGHYRLGFIIFLMQLSLNVTISIFCHTLQDDQNTRRYVVEYILLDNRFKLSSLTEIYRKLSYVSQHVTSGIEKYNRYEQIGHYQVLLNALILRIKQLTRKCHNHDELKFIWGITIGYASLPFGLKSSEDHYRYAMDLLAFIKSRKANDNTASSLYNGIYFGLQLSLMKLYDESDGWNKIMEQYSELVSLKLQDKFSIPDTDRTHYQSILSRTMSISSKNGLALLGIKLGPLTRVRPYDSEIQAVFSGAYGSDNAIKQDNKAYKQGRR